MLELCEYTAFVFDGGYRCVDWKCGGRTTRAVAAADTPGGVRERQPLREAPDLHRRFAAVEPSEEGIIAFADEWGLLAECNDVWGWRTGGTRLLNALEGTTLGGAPPTDSLREWVAQIQEMKALLAVWDALRHGSPAALAGVVEFEDRFDVRRQAEVVMQFKPPHDHARPVTVWAAAVPGLVQRIRAGGDQERARLCLQTGVNLYLCDPSLSPYLAPADNGHGLQVRLRPATLSTAIWLAFAAEIASGPARQCRRCKGPLGRHKEGGRTRKNQDYCSDACRLAAYRDRKNDALALHQQGKTVKQIARQLDVKESSVKTWIKKGGK
jgi:transposase-like protein